MDEQKVISLNWEKYKKLLGKIPQNQELNDLLEVLETKDVEAFLVPGSTRVDLVSCYLGGFVEHSLRVASCALKLKELYKCTEISNESILLTGLLHDLGKVGLLNHSTGKVIPYYLENTNDWSVKRGFIFEINPKLTSWNIQQLTLFNLQQFGILLSSDEYHSIYSIQKMNNGDGGVDYPKNNEPKLSVILKQAIVGASLETKGKQELNLV
jgi:hypothetical protein